MRKATFAIRSCLTAALPLMLTACGDSGSDIALSEDATAFQMTVPVVLVPESGTSTRATTTGDPGVDDELDPPTNLYVFSWIQTGNGEWDLYYNAITDIAKTKWTYYEGDTDSENADSRWVYNSIAITFNNPPITVTETQAVGHTYVIASTTALTPAQLTAVYSDLPTEGSATILDSSPDATLEDAEVTFISSSGDDWNSNDFRDLYSNPIGNTIADGSDYAGYEYGDIVGVLDDEDDGTTGNRYVHTDIRLYHCAAKMDFTWETATSLQSTTWVSGITVTGLPAKCKVFQPTDNPTGTATSTIKTDDGNKWTGREYVYALQPPGTTTTGTDADGNTTSTTTGTLSYTVSKHTTSTEADGNATEYTESLPTSMTFTPDNVFTGWFRVIATVSDDSATE